MMTAAVPRAGTPHRETLETTLATRAMGGALQLRIASTVEDGRRAERDLRRVADRVDAWARRLTRFDSTSDLSVLNDDPAAAAALLRPTIGAVMSHARDMATRTEGTVDVTMLDERIAAGRGERAGNAQRSWWGLGTVGHGHVLTRGGRLRFDLDGVAKGWIADRALRLLDGYPGALVDADGDVAVRAPVTAGWHVAIDHPHDGTSELGRVRLPPDWPADRFGVATSGTSVHRWDGPTGPGHHLIDPLTGRPAVTDVVQATVVAESAAVAECLAKSAVIRGSEDGLGLLQRAGAWAAVLLLEGDELITTPHASGWLA